MCMPGGELIYGVHAERGPRNGGERHVNALPPRPTPALTWLESDYLNPVPDGSSRDILPGKLSFVCFSGLGIFSTPISLR